jgi:hypothetical protein
LKWGQQKKLARIRKPLLKGAESLAWAWLPVQLQLMAENHLSLSVNDKWWLVYPAASIPRGHYDDAQLGLAQTYGLGLRLDTADECYSPNPEGFVSGNPRLFKCPNKTGSLHDRVA